MAYYNQHSSDESVTSVDETDLVQRFECPFSWDMESIVECKIDHVNDEEEELFPLLRLMRHIMTVYVDTKSKVAITQILREMQKCDDIMVIINQKKYTEISADVVNFVLKSTLCCVFSEFKLQENFLKVFNEMRRDWRLNKKEKSTLLACRSICWSRYQREEQAGQFIRQAIKENDKCDLWQFMLGKHLRRKRRELTINSKPSMKEMFSFERAYDLSNNPFFGVFLAQMYRESMKPSEAKRIYNKIFEQKPTETNILLRLALGFIRLRNYQKAEVCLDEVAKVDPTNSMYLHYRGIYYLDHKNYMEAVVYLKEASKGYNIAAEKQYLGCLVKLDKSYDVVNHLLDMLLKYYNTPKLLQPLYLDVALAYWLIRDDLHNAVMFFHDAVKINPKASCITNYFPYPAIPTTDKNIYQLLVRDILPLVEKYRVQRKVQRVCVERAEFLKRCCDEYFEKKYSTKNINMLVSSLADVNIEDEMDKLLGIRTNL